MKSMYPKRRDRSHDAPVRGCLGRVVNLFDLTSGIARNKLLTDKPHCDVSPLSRSRSDISRMVSPIAEEMEVKMIDSDTRSSSAKKLEGTPVKKLIAQEMSNSLESRHSSPNVVAKLMGLDALPQAHHLPDFGHRRRISKCHARYSYSEIPEGYWQPEDDFIHGKANCEDHHCQEQHKHKGIYEIWPPSFQTRNLRSVSPRKGRHNDLPNEEKMALVRQKFMEAKRLSTDENLHRTKEFQDALEVLSSNQELFLKVLQEPDSLLSGHFAGMQQIPPPLEAKRITVLKPSKLMSRSEKQFRQSPTREQANGKVNHHHRVSPSVATLKVEECPTQPTRIVVLKPSPGRIQDVKALVSSTPLINLRHANIIGELGDDETREGREVAKEITQKIRENLAGHRRDETLLSSVFSNGYTGDESSFNKSEAEFLVGNLSDSEVMSPTSRHSWDYVNQYGSPYSCSSFSHASYSPESSVCREAKKRLSERWAMVASNGTGGEQRHVRRSSSTLGEMLALSDVKKSEIFEIEDFNKDQGSRASTSCCTGNTRDGEIESPQSLTRSKSLPVSSTASGQRLNAEALDQEISKTDGLKEKETLKQMTRSSFRGKVTKLFFSGIKKSSKTKIGRSPNHYKAQLDFMETSTSSAQVEGPFDHNSKCSLSEENHSPNKSGQGTCSMQGAFVSNQASALKLGDSQDQPSPFLVLEQPTLEDDGKAIKGSSSLIIPNELDKHFSLGKSNLIDKSPPIGSIPRTLSWEEPCTETSTSNPLKPSILSPRRGAEEEEEWVFLVRSLLSAASLVNVPELSWHSPESLLDPSLRDKFVNLATNEPPSHEGRWRHLRSIRLLVFDCVNAALVDITSPGSNARHTGAMLADGVWARVEEWLHVGSRKWEPSWVSWEEDDGGDESCLVAERVTRNEVMGRGWEEERRWEVEMMVKEIDGKLVEDMVEEFVGECLNGHRLLTAEIL